jgi:hypothetical protein
MRPPVKITVRDGRPGAAREVLGVVERTEALDIGDKVTLADGTDVFVLGAEEKFGPDSWEQIVSVGYIGDRNSPPGTEPSSAGPPLIG